MSGIACVRSCQIARKKVPTAVVKNDISFDVIRSLLCACRRQSSGDVRQRLNPNDCRHAAHGRCGESIKAHDHHVAGLPSSTTVASDRRRKSSGGRQSEARRRERFPMASRWRRIQRLEKLRYLAQLHLDSSHSRRLGRRCSHNAFSIAASQQQETRRYCLAFILL
jgi:hypothetical protein